MIKKCLCDQENDLACNEIIILGKKLHNLRNELLKSSAIINKAPFLCITKILNDINLSNEKYINVILDSSEKIQSLLSNLSDENIKKLAILEIIKIFEACNFQDITSQQIKQIKTNIDQIDLIVKSILKILDLNNSSIIANNEPLVLLGPQIQSDAPSQNEIDDLFNKSSTGS